MSLRIAPIDYWLRAFRTARHLRVSQIAWRLRRVLSTRIPCRRVTSVPAPDEVERLCQTVDRFPEIPEFSRGCLQGTDLLSELERGELTLVNQTLPFNIHSPDWRLGPQRENRLWAITLHYHAWLYELATLVKSGHPAAPRAASVLRSLLEDWLRACRCGEPGVGALAWNSYAIATRIGWWVRLWFSLGGSYWKNELDLRRAYLESLYQQASCLAKNLEWDLRANHLLRDAVGLACAGRFFTGPEGTRWLEMATEIAVGQANEQMAGDGGHFERSPFYHLEVMDDWLSLALLLPEEEISVRMRATWRGAAEYVRWLCHPDGRTPQFNDGASVLADEHLRHGKVIGDRQDLVRRRGRHFPDSGVAVWHDNQWSVFFDVGQIGPVYQPGHAHADTLTIECSFAGKRLFVDPGCHSYDHDQRRQYDRATASHNTVCIDDTDSSEVWHIFRVGRRARPVDVQVDIRLDQMSAAAAHDGYRHLPGKPCHHRAVHVAEHGPLQIRDRISGTGEHRVQAGWLLAPHWDVMPMANGWMLACERLSVRVNVESDKPLNFSIVQANYHPEYGKEISTQRIQWDYQGLLPLEVCCTVARVS